MLQAMACVCIHGSPARSSRRQQAHACLSINVRVVSGVSVSGIGSK